MRRKDIGSLLVTIVCAVLILGAGYVGIVKGGALLLSSEEEPQKAEFENTSSNVFYGKIEDDIQLFPWNYYNQNVMDFDQEGTEGIYLSYDIEFREEIFRDMVAERCGVDRQAVDEAYIQKGSGIKEALRICEVNSDILFFYQDILEIEGKKYQVKLVFDYYNLLNFSCIEYREEDLRGTEKWEKGKEALTEMISEHSDKIDEQFYYMEDIYYFAQANGWIDGWVKPYDEFDESSVAVTGESAIGYGEDYSYQVIELKDMILLLVQGDITIGFFYDPINEVFCGYNYFVE